MHTCMQVWTNFHTYLYTHKYILSFSYSNIVRIYSYKRIIFLYKLLIQTDRHECIHTYIRTCIPINIHTYGYTHNIVMFIFIIIPRPHRLLNMIECQTRATFVLSFICWMLFWCEYFVYSCISLNLISPFPKCCALLSIKDRSCIMCYKTSCFDILFPRSLLLLHRTSLCPH